MLQVQVRGGRAGRALERCGFSLGRLSLTMRQPASTPRPQFKALTRITVKPLVETLPCLGGVTVSLMEVRGGRQWPASAGCAVQHE